MIVYRTYSFESSREFLSRDVTTSMNIFLRNAEIYIDCVPRFLQSESLAEYDGVTTGFLTLTVILRVAEEHVTIVDHLYEEAQNAENETQHEEMDNDRLSLIERLIKQYHTAALMGARMEDSSYADIEQYNEMMQSLIAQTEKLFPELTQEVSDLWLKMREEEKNA